MAREVESEGGGFFGKFLVFFLGLLLGIIIPIAAVAAVAYTVLNKPTKETVNMIDASGNLYNTIFNAETGFINPDYADKLALDLLKDTASAVTALAGGGSLEDLAKISPKVGTAIDSLVEQTDFYGLGLKREEILAKPVAELLPYLQENINNAPLGNLLQGYNGVEITDPLLLTICFGSESHYTRVETENNVTYEMKQITYVYKDKDETDDDHTKKMYDIDGSYVEGTFNEETKIFTLQDGTVYYLKADESEGAIAGSYLVFEDEARETPVKYAYTTIGTLTQNPSSMVDSIYLCDAMGITNANDAHGVLLSLAYGVEGVDYEVNEDGSITTINNPRTIGELKEGNQDLINSIAIADAMGVNAQSHKIFISLAYGVEGTDYKITGEAPNQVIELLGDAKPRTLGDLSGENSQNLMNDIHLTDIIKPDKSSAITMYLLYGKKDIHWGEDAEGNIVCLEKKIAIFENKAYNEWGDTLGGSVSGGVYTDAEGNTFKYKAFTPVKTVKTDDGEVATLYILTDMEGNSVGDYEPATLGSFSESDSALSKITERMTVSEIIGDDANENFLFKHIQDETIKSLPEAVNNLTVNQVFENDIYEKNADDTFKTDEYGNKVAKGTWKYLLKKEDGTIGEYKLQEINMLVDNMTRNVQKTSLSQLYSDGLLSISDPTALNKTLPSPINGKTTLGALNINELFELVLSVPGLS